MKYAKPDITLEKYTLSESIMADAEDTTSSAVDPDGPVIEDNDPEVTPQSAITDAFKVVFNFSNN